MNTQTTPFIKTKTRALEKYAKEMAKNLPMDELKNVVRMKRDGITIFCPEDGCDWKEPAADYDTVLSWHNEKCPKCGVGDAISDSDVIQFVAMNEVMETVNKKTLPEGENKLIQITETYNSKDYEDKD